MIFGYVVFDSEIVEQRLGAASLTHHVERASGTSVAIMRYRFPELKQKVARKDRAVASFSTATKYVDTYDLN
jgi:hypothetical protein